VGIPACDGGRGPTSTCPCCGLLAAVAALALSQWIDMDRLGDRVRLHQAVEPGELLVDREHGPEPGDLIEALHRLGQVAALAVSGGAAQSHVFQNALSGKQRPLQS